MSIDILTGWTPNKACVCPTKPYYTVYVRMRNGVVERAKAGCWDWKQYGRDDDIISWRLADD